MLGSRPSKPESRYEGVAKKRLCEAQPSKPGGAGCVK
jgi:hypothetical protein